VRSMMPIGNGYVVGCSRDELCEFNCGAQKYGDYSRRCLVAASGLDLAPSRKLYPFPAFRLPFPAMSAIKTLQALSLAAHTGLEQVCSPRFPRGRCRREVPGSTPRSAILVLIGLSRHFRVCSHDRI
jgi:hypothetical protein